MWVRVRVRVRARSWVSYILTESDCGALFRMNWVTLVILFFFSNLLSMLAGFSGARTSLYRFEGMHRPCALCLEFQVPDLRNGLYHWCRCLWPRHTTHGLAGISKWKKGSCLSTDSRRGDVEICSLLSHMRQRSPSRLFAPARKMSLGNWRSRWSVAAFLLQKGQSLRSHCHLLLIGQIIFQKA